MPVDAPDFHFAVHHCQQTLYNREAKPGSLNAPVPLLLQPQERFGEFVDVLLPNADSGIRHADFQFAVFLSVPKQSHTQGNGTGSRVFHGVCEQIGDNLPQAHIVAIEGAGNRRVNVQRQFQSLFRRPFGNHVRQIINQFQRLVAGLNQFHFPVLNLGEIKDTVNQGEQGSARALDICGVFQNIRVSALIQNHLVHAKDGVNGRPDFMAHLGKEHRFRFSCADRRFRRLQQLAVDLLLPANQAVD